MVTSRPYIPADIAAICGREYEREFDELARKSYADIFATGPAFTICDGERPVASGGVVPIWRHVGEAWLHLSPWFSAHPQTGCRMVRRLFRTILKQHEFHRIHAAIRAEMLPNRRLVEYLGFREEVGALKCWAADKDYVMYAMTNEGKRLCLQR
jgi:RimJ/RimL family protein N-acetyltransferase